MHGGEDIAAALAGVMAQAEHGGAPAAGHAHQRAIGGGGVIGVGVQQRLGAMGHEAGDGAGARHAVPLVAQAAGVEGERVGGVGRISGGAEGGGDEALYGGGDAAALIATPCHGPACGGEGGVFGVGEVGEAGDVELPQ